MTDTNLYLSSILDAAYLAVWTIHHLYHRYTSEGEDRQDFGPQQRKRKSTSQEAWSYRTYEELGSSSKTHFGKVGRFWSCSCLPGG